MRAGGGAPPTTAPPRGPGGVAVAPSDTPLGPGGVAAPPGGGAGLSVHPGSRLFQNRKISDFFCIAYVAHFVFLGDVWSRSQRAASR